MDYLSNTEMIEYAMMLEQYHSVFYRLLAMSRIHFDEKIPTAAVAFDVEDGKPIVLSFNPKFWDKLSVKERCWILAHEMWHIINGHGARIVKVGNKELMNQCMDVVVHYALENSLGLDREEFFPDWRNYCFFETMFKDRDDVEEGESSEYYYNILYNSCECGGTGCEKCQGDQGKLISWGVGEMTDEVKKQIYEALADSMSQEEIKDLIEFLEGNPDETTLTKGDGSLGAWLTVKVPKVKPKPRWETIIKKWVHKALKEDFTFIESWADMNRRMSQVLDENKDAFLPVEVEKHLETKSKSRNRIVLFMDASGSCYNYKDRFFAAARSIPKKKFDITLCSFDTKVFELNINDPKMRGGGGTSFWIMEEWINKVYIPKHGHYPDAVFLITDGVGDPIKPQHPDRWYWFLTPYNWENYIPKESHKYFLKDFA